MKQSSFTGKQLSTKAQTIMKTKLFFIPLTILFLFVSCSDLSENQIRIDEKYFIETDPAADFKTLYYDLGNGTAIERIRNIKKAGHTENHIVVQAVNDFYFIEKGKDNQDLNAQEMVEKKSTAEFKNWLREHKDFKFDYSTE